MTKPPVLVHPPLGLFELQLANSYEVLHWPTDRPSVFAPSHDQARHTLG